MKNSNTYLNFDGNTREAMTFYAKCMDADVQIVPFGDQPGVPAEAKDRVLHARIAKGDVVLMASDTPHGTGVQPGDNFYININCESQQEIERLFAAFGEGGAVISPLADMFWGAHWGVLKDRFGIGWMFNFEKPHA